MPLLKLPPVENDLPSMNYVCAFGQEITADVIFLVFETAATSHTQGVPHQTEKATIRIPLRPLDAAGLLNGLKKLEKAGIIPHVVEPSSPRTAN